MMKIAIVGKPGFIEKTYLKSTSDVFSEVGLNTGNLAFWYAVTSHITDHKEFFGWDFEPEYINNHFDRIIFIGANQLNPQWDMGLLASKFSKLKIPLLVVGIGAQAELGEEVSRMKDGTVEFMHIISQKSTHISIRGDFTKKVFEMYGINNVEVTGCPSNFINLNQDIENLSNPKKLNNHNIRKIVMNVDIIPKMEKLLPLVVDWTRELDHFIFVTQAPLNVVELTRTKNKHDMQEQVRKVRDLIMPGSTLGATVKFINSNFKSYYNTETWMEEIRTFTLSIGSRMHGNMLAFQAGVPTVFIPHDARVLEMFQTMKLPYVTLDKVMTLKNINSIINEVVFDPEVYKKNRKMLASKYVNIYLENDIGVTNELLNLVNES